MSIHVLGIRHHGPGSARNVKSFLEQLKPDIVLVEGPPEADAILEWALHEELKPPIAILCYQPDDPRRSVFYPFAEFSPEWQAILYARKNKIPVRFFDLPIAQQFALEKEEKNDNGEDLTSPDHLNDAAADAAGPIEQWKDPISYLAEAAGFEEGEKWWEQMFEYRQNDEEVFEAVTEAMQSLRETLESKKDKREQLREAHMRKMIREAEKEMYTTIAVICGAWHAPALVKMPKQKEDNDLLKGLSKVKVECTWIPWTYSRLSYYSGYGAGIHSPGWYEHIWHYPKDDGTRWLSKVANLFRQKGMDTSVAHVIEAVRLSQTLASLRGLSKAGLEELNEATWSVLCSGEDILMNLIYAELIVSNKIGEVPVDIPKPPLQVDIEKTQKSLRLPATADHKDYTLDLRKETDLARSIFLHRLRLLGIKWGEHSAVSGKGTFKEQWRLQWDPSFSIDIIERGSWGNTVEEAANKYIIHKAEESKSLLNGCKFLQEALPAELHVAVEVLVRQINNLSATSGDVVQLMEAIPPLVNVAHYGNVRNTDAEMVLNIVSGLVARVCIGLPNAVSGIDEESAQKLLELIQFVNDAIILLQNESLITDWRNALGKVAFDQHAAHVLSGYSTRLLTDQKIIEGEELIKAFHYRMSSANPPDASASWLEGFLKGSGSILLIDADLWNLVNQWVAQLDIESFTNVLPLLRRTFSNFTTSERRKLGEKVKSGGSTTGIKVVHHDNLDSERGKKGIPIVMKLLGISSTSNEQHE
jgi:hypothetical protein